jgi:hypothetical protein
MADMGSLRLPKDNADFGSPVDNVRLAPGIFFPHLL